MDRSYCITLILQGVEFSTTQTGLANMAAAAVAASKTTEFNILSQAYSEKIYDLIAHFERKTNEPYCIGPSITIRDITPIDPTTMILLDADNIGEEIKKARYRLHLSQRELAKLAGVPSATMCKIEKGYQHPRQRTTEKIRTALAVYTMEHENP